MIGMDMAFLMSAEVPSPCPLPKGEGKKGSLLPKGEGLGMRDNAELFILCLYFEDTVSGVVRFGYQPAIIKTPAGIAPARGRAV